MTPTTLAIIGSILWMVIVTFACGFAALMVIGRAFGGSARPGLPDLILSPGLKVADGNLAIVLGVSWVCWAVIGVSLIWGVWFFNRE